MKKILIVYFSATGTTKKLAKKLSDILKADLFEIKPTIPYTSKDLDWTNKNSRSSIESKNPDFRPEIKNKVENFSAYDTIFIGFPIWWYVAPNIISTFLESYDFSHKTIIPFATSGGSGMGKTEDILKKCCSESSIWKSGKCFENFDTSALKKWIDSLSIE